MTTITSTLHMGTERLFARGFVIIGGLFWVLASFVGPYLYGGGSVVGAFGVAVYPLVFTLAVLAIGWFFEKAASLLLVLAAIATVAWGVIMGWESGVWAIMLLFFVSPSVVASLLFFIAGSQDASSVA